MTVPELTTDRLVLRPWRADDDADVAAAYEIYRHLDVVRWLGSASPDEGLDDARARLERYAASDDGPGLGRWAVTADGVPVGTVLLRHLPDADGNATDDVEIGWHLGPDAWGHGYASEAARAVLDHGFDAVGLDEIIAVAYAGNEPSFAVMRRIGLTRQGVTDRWYGETLDWWRISRAPARPPAATRSTS